MDSCSICGFKPNNASLLVPITKGGDRIYGYQCKDRDGCRRRHEQKSTRK